MRKLFFISLISLGALVSSGQTGESPNYANSSTLPPGSAQASKITDNPVNLFTGQPNVSIPVYSFSNNSGLRLNVSLEYIGGSGVQVNESPSILGMGWLLNAGGSITRIVRGMPDDMKDSGYLFSSAIPQDWRSKANKYYSDSIDSQQDIFQFSFPGHSGKFFIGKNSQIVTLPLTKIRIIPTYRTTDATNNCTLKSFRIIAEDGVKYDFEDLDLTSITVDTSVFGASNITYSAYYGKNHGTSWNLTRIISPFSSDTIKFNYTGGSFSYGYKLPQVTYVNNSTGVRKTPWFMSGTGTSGFRKITSIQLPDKTTVSFVYSFVNKYSSNDYVLSKIKISDTTFRFGYALGYDTTYAIYIGGAHPHYDTVKSQPFLSSVTPYTKYEKQDGYRFQYNDLLFPMPGAYGDSIQNKRDYWGYYNARYNPGDSAIPKISPYTWGADRRPAIQAMASTLSKFYLPTGGYVAYGYEMNDHIPYTKQNNTVSIAAQTSSSNTVSFNQVYNTKHQLVFLLDKTVSRSGSAPISGPGELNVYVKNTAGTTTYISTTISLYDLYYSGLRTYAFNLANGSYKLETSLGSGTSITGSLPLDIKWQNRTENDTLDYGYSGGVRVNYVMRSLTGYPEGSYEQYKYVREDGKSSGFLGDIPTYDYQYREVVINGGTTTTDYTAVCSEPFATTGFILGAPVGYSRVEIIRQSSSGNLGKEVQEYTDLKDVNCNDYAFVFPFTPQDFRAWGLGLPKRISVYDSSGTLVKRTVNTIQFDTAVYNNNNFKSVKLGNLQTTYNGNPASNPPKTKNLIGEEYYLTTGRAYVTSSKDTLYQANGSINTMYQNMVYDTNYNVTTVTSSFDRTRGIEKEERMYYPYNYTVGGGIGKLRDSSVIAQTVAVETWLTGDGNPRIISGLATSFRAISNNEVKPDTIYAFESNKPIAQATITTFDPSKLNRNTTYFKPQTYFTSYDSKGNLSESKNLVTGISNAVIIDYDQQYAIAKISNSTQTDLAYTSFESTGTGNWTVGGSARDATDWLTGKKSYNLSNGTVSKTGLTTSKNYLVTLWVKSGASVSVNSTAVSGSIATQGNWSLYSIALTGISSVTISGSGLIDEVRLHLKDANMETYAYEPLIGVISGADANNTIAYNEYDKLNRLKLIRDKDKNIAKRFDYSDTTMVVSTAPTWVGFAKQCNSLYLGKEDSLYHDTNPFSDSAGYVKTVLLSGLNCSCPNVASNPQYAVINGVCEAGTWGVVSSVYGKYVINGVLQFGWKCTYRYCFSDGTQSSYNEIVYQLTSCSITCFIDP